LNILPGKDKILITIIAVIIILASTSPAIAINLPEISGEEIAPIDLINTLIRQQGTLIILFFVLIILSLMINMGFLFSIWNEETLTKELMEQINQVSESFNNLFNRLEEKGLLGVDHNYIEILKGQEDQDEYIEIIKTRAD